MRVERLPHGVFALRHARGAGVCRPTAVVLVPPFGTEESSSYRERRWLAEHLARAGHETLRIDLPAAGDSADVPLEQARVAAWAGAVAVAAARLREDNARVAVIALGLGGVAAAAALRAGAQIDDLVLWGVPSDGRAAVRRLRALSRLQPWPSLPAGQLPEGSLEIGGYVLDGATLEHISRFTLGDPADAAALERLLVLHRDGEAPSEALATSWSKAGVVTEVRAACGYDAMIEHPQRTNPPWIVADALVAWLAEAPVASDEVVGGRPPVAVGPLAATSPFVLPAANEAAYGAMGSAGALFGVLARPIAGTVAQDARGLCVVLFNAGAQRRSGPNRMWTEAARRWAAAGITTLRIDLAAVGDSDGDEQALRDDGAFYGPKTILDARAVLDALERDGVASRFVVGGLCSGAYAAFHLAATDARIIAVALLNPQILVWRSDVYEQRSAQRLRRALTREGWSAFVRGGVSVRVVLASLVAAARLAARGGRRQRMPGASRSAPVTSVRDGLDRLRDAAVPVMIGFSGGEPLVADLEAAGIRKSLAAWPRVTWVELPGTDHELRPIAAQREAHSLLDRAVAAGCEVGAPAADRSGVGGDRHGRG